MMKKHPHYPDAPTFTVTRLADTHLNPLLAATVEAIFNAMVAATTVVGRDGRRVEAISIPTLQRILEEHAVPPVSRTGQASE